MRDSPIRPIRPGIRPVRGKASRSTPGVADFLRSHDRLAALLGVAERLAALERDCASLLPAMAGTCRVLHLDGGQLVLSVPSAAYAAKLKQQLPKLQDGLAKRGWQVNAIRLKVQAGKMFEKSRPSKQLLLPVQAAQAFSELDRSLADSPANQALKTALRSLLERHRR